MAYKADYDMTQEELWQEAWGTALAKGILKAIFSAVVLLLAVAMGAEISITVMVTVCGLVFLGGTGLARMQTHIPAPIEQRAMRQIAEGIPVSSFHADRDMCQQDPEQQAVCPNGDSTKDK